MKITNVSWREDRWFVLFEEDNEMLEVEVWPDEDDYDSASTDDTPMDVPLAHTSAREFVREHGDGFGDV